MKGKNAYKNISIIIHELNQTCEWWRQATDTNLRDLLQRHHLGLLELVSGECQKLEGVR